MDTRFAAEWILPLFYPVRCPVCQDIVMPKGGKICASCRDLPHYIDDPVCMKCGRQVGEGEELCGNCRAHARSFERGFSLMRYDGIGQESIRNFKENGRQEYAAWYAEELMKRRGEALRAVRADALVPVPLHPNRLRKRGYNQAFVLAEALGKQLALPVLDVLQRTKDTGRQKKLGPEGRRRNLAASIRCGALPENVSRILLVDDVFTTGSTVNTCSEALYEAGAAAVCVVTVCMAG